MKLWAYHKEVENNDTHGTVTKVCLPSPARYPQLPTFANISYTLYAWLLHGVGRRLYVEYA
jgi:hypothetical protein